MVTPRFSVVIATYGRGRHIAPTLESVARQSLSDFEVLVVSDGRAERGLVDAVSGQDGRFRLLELGRACGSQSGPNAHGWEQARGRHVAYLGHDDIWLPTHLEELDRAFSAHPEAALVASGCVYLGPLGSGARMAWVTGLLEPGDVRAPLRHLLPPSALAHVSRPRVPLPAWRAARDIGRPVDSQFTLEAAELGHIFAPTGVVTVVKLNSSMRYLSYLCPDSEEQERILALGPDEREAAVRQWVDDATAAGNVMSTFHPAEGAPGRAIRDLAQVRGLSEVATEPLRGRVWMPPGAEPRGYDWHPPEEAPGGCWRWSGPSPRPRLAIPFTHGGAVRARVHVSAFAIEELRSSLTVLVNGAEVPSTVAGRPGEEVVEFAAALRMDAASVVELRMPRSVPVSELDPASQDGRRIGLALVGVELEPRVAAASGAERTLARARDGAVR